MGCKVVSICFLAIGSALVDSFPYPGSIDGAYRVRDRQSDPIYFKHQSNVNPSWQDNQGIPQSRPNPMYVWNNENDNEKQQIERNNLAIPTNVNQMNGYGQSSNNIKPVETPQNGYYPQRSNVLLPRQSSPVPYTTSNILSEGLWNSQELQPQQPAQSQIFGTPYEGNNFVQNYANPYVNQGNYGQIYSQYQPTGLMTPKPDNVNSYGQGYLPQNQYNIISAPRPIEYLRWPVADNQHIQKEQLLNDQNVYNIPVPENSPSKDLETIPPEPVQVEDQEPVKTSQQPENNQIVIPKQYIIVHMNGTYEHINNLNDIVVDKYNMAHIKSKDEPKRVMAIIEVEEADEKETPNSFETPYDTGITKIPRDSDWNANNQPSTIQSYKYPMLQTTTEDTNYDMKYFKAEYIMPIQLTTENTIHSTTKTTQQATTTYNNIDSDNNNSVKQSNKDNTIISTTDSLSDSPTLTPTDSSIDSSTENSTESSTKSPIDSSTESPTDSLTDSHTDSPTNSSTESSVESPADNSTESSAESATDSPTDSSTECPTVNLTASPTNSSTENSTENSTDSSTHSSTESSTESPIDSSTKILTVNRTDSPTNSSTDNTTYDIITATTIDTKVKTAEHLFTTQATELLQKLYNYDYEDIDSIEETKNNTSNTESHTLQQTSSIDRDAKENNIDVPDMIKSSNLNRWIVNKRDYENGEPANNNGPEQTSDDNDAEIRQTTASSINNEITEDPVNEIALGKDNSTTTQDQSKLGYIRQIDLSELKTVVSDPVVWFRTDEKFWDKLTKGEQAFDAVSIYDVQCKPKLIERITSIHHYANGTETVDSAVIVWDSPDAKIPKDVRAKREFRESK